MKNVPVSSGAIVSSRGISTQWKSENVKSMRQIRSRQFQLLSVAAASVFALGSSVRAADTIDSVNLAATAALDTTTNYSTNALPTTTQDMTFLNGSYTNTAFTLNTTALTPGTLDDLDTTQLLSITGTKSITLKTLANATVGAQAADLLYVAAGGSFNVSAPITLGVTGGNFDIAGTSNISGNINGSTATFSLTKTGAGTLSLTGTETYTGATGVNAGTLILNFAGTGAPTTNIISPSSILSLSGGTLAVTGASASSTQAFASTTFVAGSISNVSVTGGATLSQGAFTAAAGAGVVYNGPATINALGNVAATGIITTTTAGLTGTTPAAVGILATANGNNDYATVGLYDWASTDVAAGTAGTTPYTIIGGSQVTGFYNALANNTNPGLASDINLDVSVQQTPTGVGGTTNIRISSTGTTIVDSIRFNSSHAPYVTVKSGTYLEAGGVLVTPNAGSVNTAIDGLRLGGSGVQIVQNNTGAVLVIGQNLGGGGPFFSNVNSAAENVVKSGAGTLFLDPTTNNIPINYQSSTGAMTTVASAYYNYANSASSSYFAAYLNGGVTVINNANSLGNPIAETLTGNTFGTSGSVNLNGGTLMSNLNNVSLVNAASASVNRPINIGADGGGLAAAAGTTLTVAGFIEPNNGNGVLNIGIPASTANGNVAGLVPGTGGTTVNAALMATGTVVLTAGNGYTGGTVVNSGTLNINGYYALGGGNYGGLTLNGGTLQYATNTAGAGNGGGDVSFLSSGLTIGASGGTIDLNGNPIAYTGTLHNGGGALTVASTDTSHAGVLTLSGNSTLASITVNSGGLVVTGALTATPITVNTGSMLSGTGSTGPVTLSGGTVASGLATSYLGSLTTSALTYNNGILQFGIGTAGAGNISTGSATFNATPSFSYVLSGSPTSGSSYTVLSSATTFSGVLSANQTLTPTTIGRLTFTPSVNSTDNAILVNLSGTAGNLIWNNGAATGLWNITVDKNFLNTATSSQDYYYEGDNVTFNDNNGGAANYTVGIATTVNPGSVTVNNSGGTYTFNGPGLISGGTSLVKLGSNPLVLNTVNTYTGGTNVSGGTLQLGVAGALPATGTLLVQGSSAVVDLNGNNQTIGGLSDGGVSTGTITSSTGSPILTLNSTGSNAFSGAITGSVAFNKIGSSTTTFSGANTYTGLTNVSNGTLIVGSNSGLGSSTASTAGLYTVAGGTASFTSTAPVIASLAGTGGVVSLGSTTATTLTVGGNNNSTTYSGGITDQAATGGVGSLVVAGTGTLTLGGANTFTGSTVIGSGATLTTGNALALQNSTLNYNTGTLSFGTLTAATVGGLTGSQSLNLANTASTAVTLSVGGNNVTSIYSGGMTGTGALAKIGTGTFTLSGSSSYSGATNVNAGTLLVTAGGSINGGAVNVANSPGAFLNVSGGSITSIAASTINPNNSGFLLSSGSATFNGGIIAASTGFDGEVIHVDGGTFTASTVTLTRNAAENALLTTAGPTSGFYVTNGVANVTSLLVGTLNSSATARFDGGTTTVGSATVGNTTNTRYNVLDVNGGTFTATDTTNGVTLSVNATTTNNSELLVTGGTATTPIINMGSSTSVAGSNGYVIVNGGTLLVGSGGIVVSSPNTFNSTIDLTSGILGATANWSTSLPVVLNGAAGTSFTLQTADSLAAAQNISLTGSLTGTGGLLKTGAGVLLLNNAANNYTGPTNISAGTLVDAQNTTLSHTSALNINSGKMIIQNSPSLSTITKQVGEGFNGGTWNGTNTSAGIPITSTLAGSDSTHLHALGVILNDNGAGTSTPLVSSFGGYSTLNDTDVLIKYTYYGDTDLNGKVDGTDYSRIDNGYEYNQTHTGTSLTGWFNGDFNYDGVMDGSDYTLIDNAFNSQGTQIAAELASPTAQIAGGSGASAVPEPTTLGLLGIGAAGLLGRRRRRN